MRLGGTGTFIPEGGIEVIDVRTIVSNIQSTVLNRGTRTTCSYQKDCTTKLPAGCVGSVALQTSNRHVFIDSQDGGKWMNSKKSDTAGENFPGAGTFGI